MSVPAKPNREAGQHGSGAGCARASARNREREHRQVVATGHHRQRPERQHDHELQHTPLAGAWRLSAHQRAPRRRREGETDERARGRHRAPAGPEVALTQPEGHHAGQIGEVRVRVDLIVAGRRDADVLRDGEVGVLVVCDTVPRALDRRSPRSARRPWPAPSGSPRPEPGQRQGDEQAEHDTGTRQSRPRRAHGAPAVSRPSAVRECRLRPGTCAAIRARDGHRAQMAAASR